MTESQLIDFIDGGGEEEKKIKSGYNKMATTGGIKNWITALNRNEVAANTDFLETVNYFAKSNLIKTNATTTYATLTITNGLQTEITANTTAITTLQEELITLGIASIVNGLFTFNSQIIRGEIAKCIKLQGETNLTGDVTTNIDSYRFYGAKPSEIACLSNVSSNIQTQLNNKLLSSALNGYLTCDSLNNYTQYYYVNSISSHIYYNISKINNTINNINKSINNTFNNKYFFKRR